MLFLILFFAELFFLFISSRSLSRSISFFFYKITKDHKITVFLMAILFFPGTLIHELSHAIMAQLLFVRVHNMEFMPKIIGSNVKLGSIMIDHTNIAKSLLIGMAPFLFGSIILVGSFFLGSRYSLFDNLFFIILMGYLAFEIGNTMFSSKKDMEGALELLLAIGIMLIILYFVGFRIPAVNLEALLDTPLVSIAFQKGSFFLLVPIIIDIMILSLLKIILPKHSL